MIIPDEAVWAAVPAIIWAIRNFIIETLQKWRKTEQTVTTTVTSSTVQPQPIMSISDFGQVAELLKKELNGRYMFAEEARRLDAIKLEKLDRLERKLETSVEELKEYIHTVVDKAIRRSPNERTRSTDHRDSAAAI